MECFKYAFNILVVSDGMFDFPNMSDFQTHDILKYDKNLCHASDPAICPYHINKSGCCRFLGLGIFQEYSLYVYILPIGPAWSPVWKYNKKHRLTVKWPACCCASGAESPRWARVHRRARVPAGPRSTAGAAIYIEPYLGIYSYIHPYVQFLYGGDSSQHRIF